MGWWFGVAVEDEERQEHSVSHDATAPDYAV